MRECLNIGDKFVVGHIGAFVNQKNHVFLIDIFSELLKREPESVLLLAGDGPLLEDIKEKAKALGIYDNVLFLGKRNDVHKLYQAMDVFVLPSLYEGLPMVGVEAQCAGLPTLFSSEITTEVNVGNASFMSIGDGASRWAEYIIKMDCTVNRSNGKALVSGAGFDIVHASEQLEKDYHKMCERG